MVPPPLAPPRPPPCTLQGEHRLGLKAIELGAKPWGQAEAQANTGHCPAVPLPRALTAPLPRCSGPAGAPELARITPTHAVPSGHNSQMFAALAQNVWVLAATTGRPAGHLGWPARGCPACWQCRGTRWPAAGCRGASQLGVTAARQRRHPAGPRHAEQHPAVMRHGKKHPAGRRQGAGRLPNLLKRRRPSAPDCSAPRVGLSRTQPHRSSRSSSAALLASMDLLE